MKPIVTLIENPAPLAIGKFRDPDVTAKGERRAEVAFGRLETLWFNTGTLCNITCASCYIESSPANDRLAYLTTAEMLRYLDEAEALGQRPTTVAFTGGEPFMNPDLPAMADVALARGHEVLILTNAMRPMQRPRVQNALAALNRRYGTRLCLRVSLDHWRPQLHDEERGAGSFVETVAGVHWLRDEGARIAIAARLRWGDTDDEMRAGFRALFAAEGLAIDADDRRALVVFPEMDERADVAEITVDCWGLLDKRPQDLMCASSRMIVKRKGAQRPVVVACTLLPHAAGFDFGPNLADALGSVKLNHPHCARFCVLGGGSCTA